MCLNKVGQDQAEKDTGKFFFRQRGMEVLLDREAARSYIAALEQLRQLTA